LKKNVHIKKELTRSIISELREQLEHLEGVYLFGSRQRGDSGEGSDWDFAFLSREEYTEEIIWNIKSAIEAKYDVNIDLIDLYKSNTILQIEVIKSGEPVYVGDIHKIREFEFLALSYYQKLNEERAEILEDIKKRGNIYG